MINVDALYATVAQCVSLNVVIKTWTRLAVSRPRYDAAYYLSSHSPR